ncbi:MAG: hypothetical protein ACM3U2_21275 [Deltaproteobacteria bacterium]
MTFVLALAWTTMLLVMDITTARPQTVSHDQILKADVVVLARRMAPKSESESDRVRVERVFRGTVADGDNLKVLNLSDVKEMADDRDYILALSRFRQDFVVTKLEGQRGPPLVYDSSPATVEEIKSILRNHL